MPNGTSGSEKEVLDPKFLGKKIRQARKRAGLDLQQLGQALGISLEEATEIETGKRDISLPQLEVLALLVNKPVSFFWVTDAPEKEMEYPTLEAIALRQRIIGLLLRQARSEVGKSEDDLAELLDVPVSRITEYELGQQPIPLPQLKQLSKAVDRQLDFFVDQGIVPADEAMAEQMTMLEELVQFSKLPKDVREFLANPANLLYINIAMNLSELSVDTLRGMAEGLLEVTY